MVWNARPVELTVAAIDPERDDPDAWAALAHQMRWVASHHGDPLTLPQGPLHIATSGSTCSWSNSSKRSPTRTTPTVMTTPHRRDQLSRAWRFVRPA
jgi:hypothetical protein